METVSWKDLIHKWNMRFNHLPWYRRYEFLLPAVVLLAVLSPYILPSYGGLSGALEMVSVAFVFFAFFVLVVLIITDAEKPVLLKRLASLSIVVLFFVFFYRYSGTEWDRVTYQFFNFEKLEGVWPLYLKGLWVTLRLSVMAAISSMILGLLIGILRSLHNPVLELFLSIYIDFFRALPLIVNMVLVFYALPFLGIDLSAFWAAYTSLVLMNSAYQAEIFRAGIESIPKRQVESARALGLRASQTMRLVVLPLAIKVILPPLTNNLVSMVKDTAVAYVITVPELLTQARHAVMWKRNPTPIIISMLIYLATLIPLTRFTRYLEKRRR